MSLETTLEEFRLNIEDSLVAIPPEKVPFDPNVSRLIRLLSLVRIAEKDIGVTGGSSGDTATETTVAIIQESIGSTNSTPATSNSGTFSFISFFKRVVAHYLAPKTHFGVTISTSGDNSIIEAPGAGLEICITGLRIQSETSTSTNVLIKRGASDTNCLRVRTTGDGTGLSESFGSDNCIRCGDNNAFILNLSAANAHQVSVIYFIRNTSTGLPV